MRPSRAYLEGVDVGRYLLPAGLNKYEPGTPEHVEWERGRLAACAAQLQRLACLAGMVA